MKIEVISFGYKYRKKYTNDIDCRDVRNPHFSPVLKTLTGLDKRVADYVMEDQKVRDLMIIADAKITPVYPTVAFGCVGGRHRSVAIAEQYAQIKRGQGHEVVVKHTALSAVD